MRIWKNLFGKGDKIDASEIAVSPDLLLGDAVIVDTGTNKDGDWVRWGNGWQQCMFRTGQNQATEVLWTFPKPFLHVPHVQVSVLRNAGDEFIRVQVGNIETTSAIIYKEKSQTNHGLFLSAIGRWK